MKHQNAFCSFCRKSHVDCGPLVEGPDENYICGDCADLCRMIVQQERRRRSRADPSRPQLSTLDLLRQRLSACLHVDAKPTSALLAGVAAHAESLLGGNTPDRSLIVLAGPSAAAGLIVTRLIASALEAPFWLIDRECLLRGGTFFSGDSELFEILKSGDFDRERFHKSIAFVDQADNRPVQEALGRMILGGADDKSLTDIGLDTRKILFVCGGAFVGLDEVALRGGQQPNDQLNTSDLVSWGMRHDLAERLHAALWWNALDEQTLFRIASFAEFELPIHDP